MAVTKATKAKKTVSKKPALKKAAVKKVVVKKPAAKAAPKKTASKPTAKKAATKTVAKKTVAKKTVAKKPAAKAAPKKVKAEKPVKQQPKGLPEHMLDAALKILDDRKAEQIVVADLRGRSAIADYALVASGNSGRQLAAIADYLCEAFEKMGVKRIRVEGVQQGDWVLLDAGDVIVHLFRPEVRNYYNIEQIWDATSPQHL